MVTVKLWREINTFDPLKDGNFDVDGTVYFISQVRNKSVEEVENMAIDDLLPEFIECVKEVNSKVFSKLDKMPKNAVRDGE